MNTNTRNVTAQDFDTNTAWAAYLTESDLDSLTIEELEELHAGDCDPADGYEEGTMNDFDACNIFPGLYETGIFHRN